MSELRIRPALAPMAAFFPDWGLRPAPGLLHDLKAVMAWPRDERARMAFHAALHFQAQALWEQVPGMPDDPLVRKLLAEQRQRIGGWPVLMESPPAGEILAQAEQRGTRGAYAGAALALAYLLQTRYAQRLQGPVSLRRVRALLARKGNPFFEEPPGAGALAEAWEEFQSVAHLWGADLILRTWCLDAVAAAAQADLDARREPRPWGFPELALAHSVMVLLSLARELQGFGLATTPKHARAPFLDPATLWHVTDLPDWEVQLPPLELPADLLERYEDY